MDSSLFVQSGPSHWMGISWTWNSWSLNTNQVFLAPLLPKTLFHGTLSSASWKGWIHSEFQVCELPDTFPPALRVLNFTVLWSLQSRLYWPSHPQWAPPCLVSMSFSRTSVLMGSSQVIRGGSCCQSAAGPSRIAYVLLRCSSSRYRGGRGSRWRPGLENVKVLLSICKGPHPHAFPVEVVSSRHLLKCCLYLFSPCSWPSNSQLPPHPSLGRATSSSTPAAHLHKGN